LLAGDGLDVEGYGFGWGLGADGFLLLLFFPLVHKGVVYRLFVIGFLELGYRG